MKPADKFDKNYKSIKETRKYGTPAELVNDHVYKTEKWVYEEEKIG